MKISEINPYVRVAMPSFLKPYTEIHQRVIFDYELIYLESGSLRLTVRNEEYDCPQGQFLLLHPGIPHSFHIGAEGLSQPHIHFDLIHTPESERIPVSFKDLPDLSPTEREWIQDDMLHSDLPHPFVRFSDKDTALSLLFAIVSPAAKLDPLTQKGRLIQLLSLLIADNFPTLFTPCTPLPIEQQIKNYIDAEQGFKMSLEDFALQFSYSKYYLDKKFQKAYGMGLIAYRNQKRMEIAKRLLSSASVSEVADRLGYLGIYSFSRAYKNYYGIAPSKNRS